VDTWTYAPGGGPFAPLDELCDRIDTLDADLHAFVADCETSEERRVRLAAELRAVHERWPDPRARPALFGVAVAVKDIVRVDGLPTRAGSHLPAAALAGAQAAVVDRLRAAGALVAGKTVTAEFAILAPGPTRNPHHPAHTPGGSSSGSAAAVAAGMVPLAIGTQTVGSVIRPAAYCGVVGFKPTVARIPVDGVVPNAPTYDTLGLHGPTPEAVETAASVLCDGWRPAEDTGRRPVLAVPEGPYLERAGTEARDAFERHVAALREGGFTVRRVPAFADFEQDVADLFTVNRYEAARSHAEWFEEYGPLYREETAAVVRQGRAITRTEYEEGLRRRDAFRARLAAATDAAGADLWISPAATGPAPRGLATTGSSIMCLPWSSAGWPSVSVPAGRAANGLPLGLQLAGRPGSDELLLRRARPIAALMPPTGPPPAR
jgi:Asp-tRNA(Asn)/Glu-tRNA(Gln) amidotransferase A subunit family amidase